MLATLTDEPFNRAGWIFEVKWDGFRAVAETSRRGFVRLYSRNEKSFANRFPEVVEALRRIKRDAILDGEIVAIDEHGKSQFQLLQNYERTGKGRLAYYVFDLLELDGEDLRARPLRERKKMLAKLLGKSPLLRYSEHVEEDGIPFFREAARRGLEGIMAKDGASPYREGLRTLSWLKIKTHLRQEAVIGGFTEPRRSRQYFGSLLLGVYEGKKLVYIGHTGGGFDAATLQAVYERMAPLEQRACPFDRPPKPNTPAHWVKPQLVCEVRFQEWTADGRMRQPIFLGLRDDKSAQAVVREKPREVASALANKSKSRRKRTG